MMELTKLQIQQINNFLEAIGVEYVDIRFEMVDHIASEIEGTVPDLDTFFKNNRLQTPFLKYMLSKKNAYKKKYDRIVKRKLWSESLVILKDIGIQALKPWNMLIISLAVVINYFVSSLETNYALIFPVTALLAYYSYNYLVTKNFKKRYGKLKIVHSYSFVSSTIAFILYQFYIPFQRKPIETTWNANFYYTLLLCFFVIFIVGSSFISRMESIENKYKQLI
ncbi:hypothetical protein SAMN04489761_2748 [Tenacibaculum sp. MAR_2009_124]|uniref:hypothetical protein n=1 Tax=Tenacibaculum sp. MAR_2009_124 TaxID=1250059 RepID=UPI0008968433|nr:hypothetical protein [Tenacibaculum sp. MAR_2009_124]SEC35049.1 hypothetical protein SAMN04489761_2748 [Tenacibaculum sp. MAR_2009_124]